MGFLDERPIAKITSAVILVATTAAYITGIAPPENNEVLTLLIGSAATFLFAAGVIPANKV